MTGHTSFDAAELSELARQERSEPVDIDREIAASLERVIAAINLRCALARKQARASGEHHRRALGQRWRHINKEKA